MTDVSRTTSVQELGTDITYLIQGFIKPPRNSSRGGTVSRKEKYLHDLCEARTKIQHLEEENRRLRDTIHRLVALKNEVAVETEEKVFVL